MEYKPILESLLGLSPLPLPTDAGLFVIESIKCDDLTGGFLAEMDDDEIVLYPRVDGLGTHEFLDALDVEGLTPLKTLIEKIDGLTFSDEGQTKSPQRVPIPFVGMASVDVIESDASSGANGESCAGSLVIEFPAQPGEDRVVLADPGTPSHPTPSGSNFWRPPAPIPDPGFPRPPIGDRIKRAPAEDKSAPWLTRSASIEDRHRLGQARSTRGPGRGQLRRRPVLWVARLGPCARRRRRASDRRHGVGGDRLRNRAK